MGNRRQDDYGHVYECDLTEITTTSMSGMSSTLQGAAVREDPRHTSSKRHNKAEWRRTGVALGSDCLIRRTTFAKDGIEKDTYAPRIRSSRWKLE